MKIKQLSIASLVMGCSAQNYHKPNRNNKEIVKNNIFTAMPSAHYELYHKGHQKTQHSQKYPKELLYWTFGMFAGAALFAIGGMGYAMNNQAY